MQRLRAVLMTGGLGAIALAGFTLPADDRAAAPRADVSTARAEAAGATAPAAPAEASVDASLAEVAARTAEAITVGDVAPAAPRDAAPARAPALETLTGSASYYADMFEGRTTASGVPFRQDELWAAHRTLPFGTRLRVTNLANGNVVEVEVVDRGPYAHGRVLDLSKAAARTLDFIRAGHTRVRIEVLSRPS